MLLGMNSVPFTVKKVMDGWAESAGLLAFEPPAGDFGGRLVFQFQTKDAVLGLIKTGVKEVPIELAEVSEVGFKGGWLGGGTLTVRVADMKAGAKLPGQESGIVALAVKRKHTEAARELASEANLQAAEARLRRTME